MSLYYENAAFNCSQSLQGAANRPWIRESRHLRKKLFRAPTQKPLTIPRKPLLALRFGIGATCQSHCADRAIERGPVSSSILTNLHLREQNTYDILCGRGSPVRCRRAAVRLVRYYDATADGLPLIPQPLLPQGEKGSVARLKRRLYVRIIPFLTGLERETAAGRRQSASIGQAL